MERTHIKHSFIGFGHRVTPLQNVFHKECDDADLNTDVLKLLSGLQNDLVENMMDGACAISHHRRSNDVAAEDLLCHLDTGWNLDPLLMSANCMKTCYQVTEATDKVNLSSSPEPTPQKRRTRCPSNLPKVNPAASKVKKNSARKSKLKSTCDQSNKKVKNSKSKVNSKSQDICPGRPFKIHLKHFNKEPELEAEKQLSIKMSAPNTLDFLGNNYKLDMCNVDGVLEPSAVVPVNKPKSKGKEKIVICENSIKIPPVEGKSELKFKIPVSCHLDPEINNFKMAGLRQKESDADAALKSSVASKCKFKPKVLKQSSTYKHSVKILPFKEKTEPEVKVPTKIHFNPETHKLRITGFKDFSKQSPEACINEANSNVEEMSTCTHSTGMFSLKEKTEPKGKLMINIPVHPDDNKFRLTGIKDFSKQSPNVCINEADSTVEEEMSTCKHSTGIFSLKEKNEPKGKLRINIPVHPDDNKFRLTRIKDFSKQSPKACINEANSNVEEISTCNRSTGVFPLKEKTEPEFKCAKQASIEMPVPYSQVFTIPSKRGKQEVSGVKYASVETLEEARYPSFEMPQSRGDSLVRNISLKRHKQEVFDTNDEKVETREEARKRLAIVLLRIAGKY